MDEGSLGFLLHFLLQQGERGKELLKKIITNSLW